MSEYNQQEMQDPQESQFSSFQSSNSNNPIQSSKPDNNLVLSIVATVASLVTCCGMISCIGVILGIIAIVFSTQVDTKYTAGDYAGAESTSKTVKLLSFIALGTVAASIIYIIISFIISGPEIFERYKDIMEQYS